MNSLADMKHENAKSSLYSKQMLSCNKYRLYDYPIKQIPSPIFLNLKEIAQC